MNKTGDEEGTAPGGFRGGQGLARGLARHGLSLVVLFALAAFPPLFHDIARDALANADMDIISVYQALSINAGLPVVTNPHTGYAYFLALAGWLHLFDWMSLVPVVEMNALLAVPDFDKAFAELIVAGRWLSVFQACLLTALVYAGVYMLNKNPLHAFVLGILFVLGGGGLAAQSVMMRTELPSMIFLFAAALALIAAPRVSYRQGLALLAVAGLCIHISLMAKIQGVIVIVFLPLLPLVFGWGEDRRHVQVPPKGQLIGVIAVGFAAIVPVAVIFYQSLIPGSPGLYQLIIAAYVIGCALVYGRLFLGGARHGVVGVAAVAVGFSLAYLLNALTGHWWSTFSMVNFIEQMSAFTPTLADAPAAKSGTLPDAKALTNVARSLVESFSIAEFQRFFAERLRNFDYPFSVFYVLVPAAAIVLALKRQYAAAVKVGYLCLMAGLIVAIFWAGRGFFNFYYSIYVEAWVILAAGVALRELAPMAADWPKSWNRAGHAALVVVLLSVVATNVRFRLLDPAAASPAVAKSACVIRDLTPLFYTRLDGYCGTK